MRRRILLGAGASLPAAALAQQPAALVAATEYPQGVMPAEALARLGVTMLLAVPWPATGMWSRRAVTTPDDLRGLRLRSYDAAGTATFRALGAEVESPTFQDVAARLAAGTLDAVLSSGDGGAGRRLWEHLPHFAGIGYAAPGSLAFVGTALFTAMDASSRASLERAARETEAGLWTLLETREQANRARMRENNVTIGTPTAALAAAMRAAGAATVAEWEQRAGAAGAGVLARYRAGA
jgi:TRAP-type C4-dicarboxylate transport system substrate-binding protein